VTECGGDALAVGNRLQDYRVIAPKTEILNLTATNPQNLKQETMLIRRWQQYNF
jgi:hypothetical protein